MHFYCLEKRFHGDAETIAEEVEGSAVGDARACPACGRTTSMLSWLPPYRVVLEPHGQQFGDFAFFDGGNSFLVSLKFKDAYEANRLTGLTGFNPVDIARIRSRKKKRLPPPKYFKVDAQYGRTALDLAACGFIWEEAPTCPECRVGIIRSWQRIVIEEGTWTGEDAFEVRGLPGTIIVSQRFKDVCQSNGITNAEFTPIENAGHDFYASHDRS